MEYTDTNTYSELGKVLHMLLYFILSLKNNQKYKIISNIN